MTPFPPCPECGGAREVQCCECGHLTDCEECGGTGFDPELIDVDKYGAACSQLQSACRVTQAIVEGDKIVGREPAVKETNHRPVLAKDFERRLLEDSK